MKAAILFSVSLTFLSLELFYTAILNLKTWNHVVYVIIPFAILGYGVGANLSLIARPWLKVLEEEDVLYWSLLIGGFSTIASTLLLIRIPVRISYLNTIFLQLESIMSLLATYSILMIPFVVVGFVVVYLFQAYPSQSSRLYSFDLLGAGVGALAFFVLIGRLQVVHSIV